MKVESVRWWSCHDVKAPRKEPKHIERGKEGDATWTIHYVQKMSGLYVLRRADTSSSELNHWQSSKSTTGIRHSKSRKLAVWDPPKNKDAAVCGEWLGYMSINQASKEDKGWNNKIMGRKGIVEWEGRTHGSDPR
jgi:hypothetical protein